MSETLRTWQELEDERLAFAREVVAEVNQRSRLSRVGQEQPEKRSADSNNREVTCAMPGSRDRGGKIIQFPQAVRGTPCAGCGRDIPAERLQVRPDATLCVPCQSNKEQQSPQHQSGVVDVRKSPAPRAAALKRWHAKSKPAK